MVLLMWLRQEAQVKKTVLVIVFLALFVDHMLLSVVVPILPSLLRTSDSVISRSGNSTDSAAKSPNTSVVLGSTSVSKVPFPLTEGPPNSSCSEADLLLDTVNVKVGLLLASKSTVQLLINPFIGRLADRIGYHIIMCAGFCTVILATIMFAFSSSYILLLLARSIQGVGGSCLSVSGMSMLADIYKDDEERGWAMGISFTGLALGLIVGAPFGSVMYQFVGKISPFLVLAVIAVLAGGLHFIIFQPQQVRAEMDKGTPLLTLLKDPYILIAAGAICLTTLIIATLETALPIWMIETMCASQWQLGIVFLPDSLSYLIASNIFGYLSQKYSGSWICACIGMILAGIATISFGFSDNIYEVIALNAVVGFSVGAVDSSVMPLMGYLVDLRYVSVYGTVYAIADIAVSIGFCVGPAIAGPIVASIGFTWLMAIIGTANIIFAPLCIFLYRPPQQEAPLTAGKES